MSLISFKIIIFKFSCITVMGTYKSNFQQFPIQMNLHFVENSKWSNVEVHHHPQIEMDFLVHLCTVFT